MALAPLCSRVTPSLPSTAEEGRLAVVFVQGPGPRGCADSVLLNKAKLMSYACVAIVFAAVFVVNTLAAAVMSGVFSMGAKKTALTADSGCQAEQPRDAGKRSGVPPHQAGIHTGCWLWKCMDPTVRTVMSATSRCWGEWSGFVTTPGDGCGHGKDRLLEITQLLRQGKNTVGLGIFFFFLIALNYSQYQWFPVTSSFWTLLGGYELWSIQGSIPNNAQAAACLKAKGVQ